MLYCAYVFHQLFIFVTYCSMLISGYLFVHYSITYLISCCAIFDPELCLGISFPLYEKYPLPVDYHHHQVESINIIQQTPPSLS